MTDAVLCPHQFSILLVLQFVGFFKSFDSGFAIELFGKLIGDVESVRGIFHIYVVLV